MCYCEMVFVSSAFSNYAGKHTDGVSVTENITFKIQTIVVMVKKRYKLHTHTHSHVEYTSILWFACTI